MAGASVIGRGTVVRGNVRGDGNLEIQGRIEGDVTVSGDVVLGEEGSVRGNVSGAQLSIAGAVQGDLRGSESVLVERGARVVGDLSAPRIGVAPGALVKGLVRTDGEAPLAQPARRIGGHAQPLRSAPVGLSSTTKLASPIKPASVPVQPAPPPSPPAASERDEEEPESEPEPPKREKAEAPPPVVPALGKHAKAKKKRREG